jgi:ribosomal protein L16 Arg81 hydroxylase
VLDKLKNHHSFVMHNMTQINRNIAEIADSIEDEFPGFHTDLHIYISPRPSSTGYNVHRDSPQHKIYIQLIGTTNWTIYKGQNEARAIPLAEAEKVLEVDFRSELTPGSAIYMPPDVFHHVVNGNGPRVSLSFPFTHDPSRVRMDRTHIPFKSIFEGTDEIDLPVAAAGQGKA